MKNEVFEKSRVINFSDAVFSIAVTLLILEIVTPTYKEMQTYNTLEILQIRTPSFIGLIVSFLVIVLYWTSHMRIMKYVSKIYNKLLWYNVFLLFFIVLLPFSTAYYVKGFSYVGPFVFYCFNLTAIGLFNLLMTLFIVKSEKKNIYLTTIFRSFLKLRALNAFLIWLLAGVIGMFYPYIARFLFLLLFLLEFLITLRYKRQLKKQQIAN